MWCVDVGLSLLIGRTAGSEQGERALFFCKRSAVQHRLRTASQMKVLHLLGAQDFQSRFHGSKLTDPAKKALYADLEEKFPEASNFQ